MSNLCCLRIWEKYTEKKPVRRTYMPDGVKVKQEGSLMVWHNPQIPGSAFYWPVNSVQEAKRLIECLAYYDDFQFKHRIKGDYANASGLLVYDEDGEWVEWYDPETGDDINFIEI